MEFFNNLLRRKKDKSVSEDEKKTFRDSEVYQRLKAKFAKGEIDFRSGLKSDSLTVGDLVDVLHLYLETAKSGLRGSFGPVARIAELSITEERPEIQEEIGVLSHTYTTPESLNRDSSLYAMKVDLQQAVEQGKDELSHYPGGIKIKDGFGDDRDKYCFLLTNRQQSDDGKPIAEAFREAGLPVISKIKE